MSRLYTGWTLLMLVMVAKGDDVTSTSTTTSTLAPAHSMARLPQSQPQPAAGSFTPSYFLGEVLPEPYVPDRFLSNASSHLQQSPSTMTSRKVASPDIRDNTAPQTKRGGFFPAPPPVQEEPEEDAKDVSLYSTRPVAFDDDLWQPPPSPPRAKHPYPFDFGPHPDHGDGELVLPSPVYPDFRHKDPPHHYKGYQHRGVSSPLKGVLGAMAALLPVGLLVASLYPNVLHVNANPAPPPPPPPMQHLK